MSTLAWKERPLEERVNLNPAFLAVLLRAAVGGYSQETDRPLPLPLAFIVVPVVLHRPTREALPTRLTTSLPIWVQEHQLLRETFSARARGTASAVREALVVALQTGLVEFGDSGLTVAEEPSQATRSTADVRSLETRANFVGRWFGHAGDVETIYFLFGVKP